MARQATIADVARRARVSISTVSNWLNGRNERMQAETGERIRLAIEELGYIPNRAAQQLKSGQMPIIGLIVPSVANPFYGAFARSIEDAALQHGYQVLLGNSERDPDREQRYAEELWAHGVRGVILGSSRAGLSYVSSLIERGLKIVAFDRPTQQSDEYVIDSVSVDNAQAVRMAIEHLLSLGHRRIAFLSGPIQTVNRLERLNGYRLALEQAGIAYDPLLVWEGAISSAYGDTEGFELGHRGSMELLRQPDPPTAIFALNDMYAFGVYLAVREMGLRIPEHVSVVGFDDIVLTRIVEPPLTTLHQPLEEIAQRIIERLLGRVQGTLGDAPTHQNIPAELIVRASTGRNVPQKGKQ